jgi:hypothetical protein
MTRPAIGTIVGRNYVPFARVLAQSLQSHHREIELVVVVADAVGDDPEAAAEPFSALSQDELHVPDLNRLRFRCTRQELVVTLKPFLLATLLERDSSALFLDADLLVLAPLDDLFASVRAHAVTVVPHGLEPPSTPDRVERDLVLNRSGAFNGGVIGLSRTPQALSFLNWWQARLHWCCLHDVRRGMHFDQRWLDLAPGFVDDLHVHRDPGVDVAHWNVRERAIHIQNGTVTAAGVPCRLFHFSGFNPDVPDVPTRYHPGLEPEHVGQARQLFQTYTRELHAAGWTETRGLRYAYESFSNGVRIPDAARRLYAELPDTQDFGDPFDASGSSSFFEWLKRGSPSPLWRFIHRHRSDLQYAHPDPDGADRRGFLRWTRRHGVHEHGIPIELV